jgi:hypothetical protein
METPRDNDIVKVKRNVDEFFIFVTSFHMGWLRETLKLFGVLPAKDATAEAAFRWAAGPSPPSVKVPLVRLSQLPVPDAV